MTNNGVIAHGIEYIAEDCGDFTRLVNKEHDRIYVQTEYTTATEVEITPENWTDYFTFETTSAFHRNGFEEPVGYVESLCIKFNDNICDRVVRTFEEAYGLTLEISCTVFYGFNGTVTYDAETDEWIINDELLSSTPISNIHELKQGDFFYYYDTEGDFEDVELEYLFTAHYDGSSQEWSLKQYIPEYDVTRIKGTLLIYDLPLLQ